jgi:hypothetical protein
MQKITQSQLPLVSSVISFVFVSPLLQKLTKERWTFSVYRDGKSPSLVMHHLQGQLLIGLVTTAKRRVILDGLYEARKVESQDRDGVPTSY